MNQALWERGGGGGGEYSSYKWLGANWIRMEMETVSWDNAWKWKNLFLECAENKDCCDSVMYVNFIWRYKVKIILLFGRV